jgi:hypothetical protein
VSLTLEIWNHPVSTSAADRLYQELHADVSVLDGVFQVELGTGSLPSGTFGAELFAQPDRWLQVAIDGELLGPRQRLLSVPYALQSQQCVDSTTLSGQTLAEIVSQAQAGLGFSNLSGEIADLQVPGAFTRDAEVLPLVLAADGAGSGLDADRLDGISSNGFTQLGPSIEGSEVSDQTLTAADIAPGGLGAASLAANSIDSTKIVDLSIANADVAANAAIEGTKIFPDFGSQAVRTTGGIGTASATPLELMVNNERVMRLEPGASSSPNVVGGSFTNAVAPGVQSATVAGGGTLGSPNRVFDWWGAIGGGLQNTVGLDNGNVSQEGGATIGGGMANTASGESAAVLGGGFNTASGRHSTVGGGNSNLASGERGVVAGGFINVASGFASTVPGGSENQAGGDHSFAGGFRARTRTATATGSAGGDQGTFVWADSTSGTFESTGSNQFLIDAVGGVGILTNRPLGILQLGSPPGVAFRFGELNRFNELITNREMSFNAFDLVPAVTGTTLFSFRRNPTAFDLSGSIDLASLDDAGNLTISGEGAKPGGGSWAVASDERLKRNIEPIEHALDDLLRLRGVYFEYRDAGTIHELPGRRIGMTAQNVESVFPDWVSQGADGFKRVTYRGFEALTVEALRALKSENDQLRDENRSLRERLERIEAALKIGG